MKDILKRIVIVGLFLLAICSALYFANEKWGNRDESNNAIKEQTNIEQEEVVVEEKETDEVKTFKNEIAQNTSNLNLRDYPSTDGKVIVVIPKNSKLDVLSQIRNGWYKVSYDSKEGYVSGEYIKILSEEEKKEITVEKNYIDATFAITDEGVNIRDRANVSGEKLTTVKAGGILRVYFKMQNGWYKVEGNAKEGFASGEHIRLLTQEEYNNLSSGNTLLDPSNNIIATYTATSSYNENSRYNMHIAADYINGTVVAPGETYSHLATIFPDGDENKYVDSYVFVDGKTVMGNGGGVCMTSSTVYGAIVSAKEQGVNTGLIVGQQEPHSKPVSYVPRKYEATVAGPSLDFSFRNVNSYSIRIDATYNYNTLTITIYKI